VKVQVRSLEEIRITLLLKSPTPGPWHHPDKTELIFRTIVPGSPRFGRPAELGLGLYICKELVIRQGGQIWARNMPGQGAVFSVMLPVFLCLT